MVIYHYPFDKKQNTEGCVLALGFFDGVHIAHRDLIGRAKAIADEKGLKLGVFTFGSDGMIKSSAKRLYGDDDKAEIFESLGADFTVIADFGAISGMSGEEFVKELLVGRLNALYCVAGFNFRFGNKASSGEGELRRYMSEAGGMAVICEEITGEDHVTLSASLIRGLITSGEIRRANSILGAPYYIKGRVSHGKSLGRTIGFPTANIPIGEGKLVPRPGVYSSAVVLDGRIYKAVTNVGVCPTFGREQVKAESYVLDFSGDLYGRELRIYLLDFIRDERKFSSAEELVSQIEKDKNQVKESDEIKWQDLGLK